MGHWGSILQRIITNNVEHATELSHWREKNMRYLSVNFYSSFLSPWHFPPAQCPGWACSLAEKMPLGRKIPEALKMYRNCLQVTSWVDRGGMSRKPQWQPQSPFSWYYVHLSWATSHSSCLWSPLPSCCNPSFPSLSLFWWTQRDKKTTQAL